MKPGGPGGQIPCALCTVFTVSPMNAIQLAPEYRRLVLLKYRRKFPRFWLSTNLVVFVIWLCFLLLIHFFKIEIPLLDWIGLLSLPLVVSTGVCAVFFAILKFAPCRWKWDDRGIRISNHRHRWSAFQRFQIDAVPALPGVAAFRIQFRDRFAGKGVWMEQRGYIPDVECLAACAKKHGVPESTGSVFRNSLES